MTENNIHDSKLSLYFPPLERNYTRNENTFYPNKTSLNYHSYNNSSFVYRNNKTKYIDGISPEKDLLKTGALSIYKNVHLFSGNSVKKNISLLKLDNIRHKSFMQLYSNAMKQKTQQHKLQPVDLSSRTQTTTIEQKNYTHHNTNNIEHKTINVSKEHKHNKVVSYLEQSNKNDNSINDDNILPNEPGKDAHNDKCKEFDMIFSNSIKQLAKIKKQKSSNRHFIKNKYTNNTVNEINQTHKRLSYLSGVMNFIYPKVIVFKTVENAKNLLYKKHESNTPLKTQIKSSSIDSNSIYTHKHKHSSLNKIKKLNNNYYLNINNMNFQ